MTTLIVPAAGKSSRFPNMKIKWLLTHPTGDTMIQKVLDALKYKEFDRVVITILRDHCEKYEADTILHQMFGDTIETLILEEPTNGPAETVYKTIVEMNIKDDVVIKDSDALVAFNNPMPEHNFITGLTINSQSPITHIQSKSFIIKNDDDIILDIIEKEIVSNIICVGVWKVGSQQFTGAYEKIVNSNIFRSDREIYVSHIISHLIVQQNVVFEFIEAGEYINWGALPAWHRELKKYNTYIFDIDGVLLKNYGKYGEKNWSNTFEPIEKNMQMLEELSKNGNQIIFMTARSEEYVDEFISYITSRGIKYKSIITECNHSKRVIINDFANTNPYPSCEALSIKRNDSLGAYLK